MVARSLKNLFRDAMRAALENPHTASVIRREAIRFCNNLIHADAELLAALRAHLSERFRLPATAAGSVAPNDVYDFVGSGDWHPHLVLWKVFQRFCTLAALELSPRVEQLLRKQQNPSRTLPLVTLLALDLRAMNPKVRHTNIIERCEALSFLHSACSIFSSCAIRSASEMPDLALPLIPPSRLYEAEEHLLHASSKLDEAVIAMPTNARAQYLVALAHWRLVELQTDWQWFNAESQRALQSHFSHRKALGQQCLNSVMRADQALQQCLTLLQHRSGGCVGANPHTQPLYRAARFLESLLRIHMCVLNAPPGVNRYQWSTGSEDLAVLERIIEALRLAPEFGGPSGKTTSGDSVLQPTLLEQAHKALCLLRASGDITVAEYSLQACVLLAAFVIHLSDCSLERTSAGWRWACMLFADCWVCCSQLNDYQLCSRLERIAKLIATRFSVSFSYVLCCLYRYCIDCATTIDHLLMLPRYHDTHTLTLSLSLSQDG